MLCTCTYVSCRGGGRHGSDGARASRREPQQGGPHIAPLNWGEKPRAALDVREGVDWILAPLNHSPLHRRVMQSLKAPRWLMVPIATSPDCLTATEQSDAHPETGMGNNRAVSRERGVGRCPGEHLKRTLPAAPARRNLPDPEGGFPMIQPSGPARLDAEPRPQRVMHTSHRDEATAARIPVDNQWGGVLRPVPPAPLDL